VETSRLFAVIGADGDQRDSFAPESALSHFGMSINDTLTILLKAVKKGFSTSERRFSQWS